MRNFKPSDFEGSGQYILRMGHKELEHRKESDTPYKYKDGSYLQCLIRKVGYLMNNDGLGPDGSREFVVTTTDITDGLTYCGHFEGTNLKNGKFPTPSTTWTRVRWISDDKSSAKQKFCDYLNNPEASDEHRFATADEIRAVMEYQISQMYRIKG